MRGPGPTGRVVCVCGHEVQWHSPAGRCLLQCADESECPCTKSRPETAQVGDKVYRLYPLSRTADSVSDRLSPEDIAELERPIEEVDAELRALGVDPVALGERGLAFVQQIKAEIAADPPLVFSQDLPGAKPAPRVSVRWRLRQVAKGTLDADREAEALGNEIAALVEWAREAGPVRVPATSAIRSSDPLPADTIWKQKAEAMAAARYPSHYKCRRCSLVASSSQTYGVCFEQENTTERDPVGSHDWAPHPPRDVCSNEAKAVADSFLARVASVLGVGANEAAVFVEIGKLEGMAADLEMRKTADARREASDKRVDKAEAVELRPATNDAIGNRVHCLKTWPLVLASVRSGRKPFEYRKHDRDYRLGDILILESWDPITGSYLGDIERRRVTYLLKGGEFGVAEGYCVMGLERETGDLTDYPESVDAVELLAMRKVIAAARAFNASILVECHESNSTYYNDEHADLLDAFAVLGPLESDVEADSGTRSDSPITSDPKVTKG